MTLVIRWTRRALARLDAIGAAIAKDNSAAADRIVGEIVSSVQNLARHPALGRIGRLADTREMVVCGSSYIVAYRVRKNDIEILTILHGAQHWPDVL